MKRFWPTPSPKAAFARRRAKFAAAFDGPALFASGLSRYRNVPNVYPFRAESHFLYFVGRNLKEAALLFEGGSEPILFAKEPDPDAVLWHGPQASLQDLEEQLGLPVRPIRELAARLLHHGGTVATLPPSDERTASWVSALLGRAIAPRSGPALVPNGRDLQLSETIIALRLIQDEAAVDQLRQAAEVTARAHQAAMRATRPGLREAELVGTMMAEMTACGMEPAYPPILTIHGEILHHETYTNSLAPTDLLLADVGAETPEGWACDVTRTWPTQRFSESQRALYEVVLAAQKAAIQAVCPGVRFRDVHAVAARQLLEGLCDLGILRGSLETLEERGAHTLFFVHGIGHLIGLDVHDMEDLGDRTGYPPGRVRSARFGDAFLRLDRDLVPGMAVTIEPGLYQIPAILDDRERTNPFEDLLCRDRLAAFADVRGIRIEDNVLITTVGHQVLTEAIPKEADEIEAVVAARG